MGIITVIIFFVATFGIIGTILYFAIRSYKLRYGHLRKSHQTTKDVEMQLPGCSNIIEPTTFPQPPPQASNQYPVIHQGGYMFGAPVYARDLGPSNQFQKQGLHAGANTVMDAGITSPYMEDRLELVSIESANQAR